jgi:Mn-dependent DtxR family transcriptional regulator
MWGDNLPVVEIAETLQVTIPAVSKILTRMRNAGVPLLYRPKGHKAGRTNKLWSHAEVEYLLRRRTDRITVVQIAAEMNRTPYAVNAMIQKMRNEGVNVEMLGQGVRRLWNPETLRACTADPTSPLNKACIQ